MYEDKNGFIMPKIDAANCIYCKRCERICPVLNYKADVYLKHKCYAAYHLDENVRHIGSSGSLFYALASEILHHEGVVYAAEMCDDFYVKHTRASDIVSVCRQMKSKYVQSDTKHIYRNVLKDLRDGKEVMFVGTPCQVKALSNILSSRMRENILLIDFVCHGVPSQRLFHDSIKFFEKLNKVHVLSFSFREKTTERLRNYGMKYKSADGVLHSVVDIPDKFPYLHGFFYHYTQRDCCYNCKHRSLERSSDLTLGDFWGIEDIGPEYADANAGYSMIVVNSAKGNQILSSLKDCVIKEIPDGIKYVIRKNSAYTKQDRKSLMHNIFFWIYRNFGYPVCERYIFQHRLWHSIVFRIDKLLHVLNTK